MDRVLPTDSTGQRSVEDTWKLLERARERERVIKEAREWAQKIHYKSTVILVGSYVRGRFQQVERC